MCNKKGLKKSILLSVISMAIMLLDTTFFLSTECEELLDTSWSG